MKGCSLIIKNLINICLGNEVFLLYDCQESSLDEIGQCEILVDKHLVLENGFKLIIKDLYLSWFDCNLTEMIQWTKN